MVNNRLKDNRDSILLRHHTITPSVVADVKIMLSESNGAGANNDMTEFGFNPYTTDANTQVYDAMNYNGAGAGLVPLVFGQMEQQPGSSFGSGAANWVAGFQNTVGPWGRYNQIYRVFNPTRKLVIIPHVSGGGGFTDSGTRVRLANYDPQYNDGAYNIFKNVLTAAYAAMAAQGLTIGTRTLFIELGGNDAINGLSGAGWGTKIAALITALIADGLIGANDKIIFDRLSKQCVGSNPSGIPDAARIANNAQIDAIVAADTTKRRCIFTDGLYPGFNFNAALDRLHFTAASQHYRGELMAFEDMEEWYPTRENLTAAGLNLGSATVRAEFYFGDYRNLYSTKGPTAAVLNALVECVGSNINVPNQATVSKQPAVSAVTLANGLAMRYATGQSSASKILAGTSPTLLTNATWAVTGVVKGAVEATVLAGEGGANANNIVDIVTNDASGHLQYLLKNSAGTLFGPSNIANGLFNGSWNRFYEYETAGVLTGKVNGVAGTPLTYTKGAITLSIKSFFGSRYNAGATETAYSNNSIAAWHEWSDILSATVEAKVEHFYDTWFRV